MSRNHHYYTLSFIFISTLAMAQVDTSAYQPELLFTLNTQEDRSKPAKTLHVLSDQQNEDFLFYVYNPALHRNDIWCTNGSKETTRLIGSVQGREDLILLGMVGNDYALRIEKAVWLMNVSEKNIRQLILKNDQQEDFNLRYSFIRNKHLYFLDDALYCSGGNQASTFKVVDSKTGEGPKLIGAIGQECELKENWIFKAFDLKFNESIWVCDGTLEGTHMLNMPSTEVLAGNMPYNGPSYLLGSEYRAIFSDENGYLFNTDGTDTGTYLLPYRLADTHPAHYVNPFTIFQDEFYWIDRESSSIWKIDNASRTYVQVCEQDSIAMGGTFAEMEGRGYWISNNYRSDPFGKKIDLISCEVTDDCEDNDCINDLFYVIQDHGNVCAYYRKPGKNKVPLPVFEQITQYENSDNKAHCIYGHLEYLSPGLFLIDTNDASWIVNLNKNTIRPIWPTHLFQYHSRKHFIIGDNLYFIDRANGFTTLNLVKI